MRIGQMNVPFLVQSCRLVEDGEGGTVTQWSTIAAFWGALEDYQERSPVNEADEVTHVITTRARQDVDLAGSVRLCYQDRVFVIREVRQAGRRAEQMRILAREQRYLN
ncbi:MAG: head-tail adaptor protein [Bdellovibrionales bacterium]